MSLSEAIYQDRDNQPVNPIGTNIYNAMSAMQKAIRHGDTDIALRACGNILIHQPNALWRRLGVTAFEDIGSTNYFMRNLICCGFSDGNNLLLAVIFVIFEWPLCF